MRPIIDVLWYGHNTGQPQLRTYITATITSLAASAHTYDPDGDGSNNVEPDPLERGGCYPPRSETMMPLVIGAGFTQIISQTLTPARLLARRRCDCSRKGQQNISYPVRMPIGIMPTTSKITDDGPRGFLINAVNWAAKRGRARHRCINGPMERAWPIQAPAGWSRTRFLSQG